MIDYCGAPINARDDKDGQVTRYSAWVGEMLFVQMMARALEPGCDARYVIILEGPEGIGKTKLVICLGAPWSQIFNHSMDSKEAYILIRGCWLAELGELDSFSRSAETRIKSFVS